MTSPGKKLRELINAPQILAMPGIFDGYSAHLVEQFGFPAGFISGAGVSESPRRSTAERTSLLELLPGGPAWTFNSATALRS